MNEITADNALDWLAWHLMQRYEAGPQGDPLGRLRGVDAEWAPDMQRIAEQGTAIDLQRLSTALTASPLESRVSTLSFASTYLAAIAPSTREGESATVETGRLLGVDERTARAVARRVRAAFPTITAGLASTPAIRAFYEGADEPVLEIVSELRSGAGVSWPGETLGPFALADYIHPEEERAMAELRAAKGLDTALAWMSENFQDKVKYLQLLQGSMPLTRELFPEIVERVDDCKRVVGVSRDIALFSYFGPINARTDGVELTTISISSMALSGLLTPAEFGFLIGHELGHINSRHILYLTLADYINVVIDKLSAATLGLGGLVGAGLKLVLYNWKRKCELTADRMGLLCCQDLRVALSCLLKLAGLPIDAYNRFDPIDFVRKLPDLGNVLAETDYNRALSTFAMLEQDHPPLIQRARELYRWYVSGEYQAVVEEMQVRRSGVAVYGVESQGRRFGPVSFQMLQELAQARQIVANDLVWRDRWPGPRRVETLVDPVVFGN